MINPFYIFIVTFFSVGMLYFLGFSEIYPPLSFGLIFFFIVVFIAMGIIGYFFSKKKLIHFCPASGNTNLIWLSILTIIITLIEGVYSHGLPLTNMLLGLDSGYADFGIPTIHVILMTFNAFLATYLFFLFLANYNKSYLFLFLLNLVPNILVVNRGMLTMIFLNCFWIYLIKLGKRIKIHHILVLIPIILFGLYAFGVMGNARLNTSYQNQRNAFDTTEFMSIGQATNSFKNNKMIPKEFFWGYIYATSPIANLQINIDQHNTAEHLSLKTVNGFFYGELIPDFIGKRVLSLKNYKKLEAKQITPELTVSSGFMGPYLWLGWPGILLFIIFLTIISILYILLLHQLGSKFFLVGLATINTIFVFNFFDNMLSFTGLSFQLIYPVMFTLWNKWCISKNNDSLTI